jgi:hypothetical protein
LLPSDTPQRRYAYGRAERERPVTPLDEYPPNNLNDIERENEPKNEEQE